VERTGKRGRPRKIIEPQWLADAVSAHRRLTLKKLANLLGVHRNFLRKHLKRCNLYERYSDITDGDLDHLTRQFKLQKPSSGLRYLIGFLRARGVKVQRNRARQSLLRIDGLGQVLRKQTLKRRVYQSARPNAFWHIDGYHKLIQWGFVIHGIVDGFDRIVCFKYVIIFTRSSFAKKLLGRGFACQHKQSSRYRFTGVPQCY